MLAGVFLLATAPWLEQETTKNENANNGLQILLLN